MLAVSMLAKLNSYAQQSLIPASSGYAPVNGSKVYYEVYGAGDPIVLLHGAYMTINSNWSELIPILSKTRKVIALELDGHGHTPLSQRPFSYQTLASDVAAVLLHLKIDSADILGFSYGGTVAFQFAIQHPAMTKKLIIISSTYKSEGWLGIMYTMLTGLKPDVFGDIIGIPKSQLAILPAKGHGSLMMDTQAIAAIVGSFLATK